MNRYVQTLLSTLMVLAFVAVMCLGSYLAGPS